MNAEAADYEYVEVAETPETRARREKAERLNALAQKHPIPNEWRDPRRIVVVHTVDNRAYAVPRDQVGNVPLFTSARTALLFSTKDGAPPRPASSRMLDATTGARDFEGLDGAAQAGMILNILEGQGRLAVAVLIASCVRGTTPCACRSPCCSGNRTNAHWAAAIDTISQASRRWLPAGSRWTYALASAIVVKIYGGKMTFLEIANDLKVDQETVSRHHKVFLAKLRGAKAKRDSEAVLGLEAIAWRDAETALRNHRIVG
jgi:hypothetical protein